MENNNFLELFKKAIKLFSNRFMNLLVYSAYIFEKLGIKYEDIISNKSEIIQKVSNMYPNNASLISLVKKLLFFYDPPNISHQVIVEFNIFEIKVEKKKPDWQEYVKWIKNFQEFVDPHPELYIDLLIIKQPEPIIDEIKTLFFQRIVEAEKINKNKVVELFKNAIKKLKEPMEREDSILESRYIKLLLKNLNTNQINTENIIEAVFKSEINFPDLNISQKKAMAKEAVDILDDVLEDSLKTILGAIYNLYNIIKVRKIEPINLTLSHYSNIIKLKDKNLIYLRGGSIHRDYDIKIDKNSGEPIIKFTIREKYRGKHTHTISYKFKELFQYIQILTASINIFKMYMESYVRDYELESRSQPSIYQWREDFFNNLSRNLNRFQEIKN
ncbi:MAG: hypothetical protein GF329_02840, partial [Candidatus Lokiarchaeota archaeon]|nr:hypothetical protein [Candidatus Lokiarchaeota archaeon]